MNRCPRETPKKRLRMITVSLRGINPAMPKLLVVSLLSLEEMIKNALISIFIFDFCRSVFLL